MHLPIARLALGGLAVILLGASLRILLVNTPDGGRPAAEVAISSSHQPNPLVGENTIESPMGPITVGPEMPVGGGGLSSTTTLEGAIGADSIEIMTAEPDTLGNLPDLVEQTAHGPLPRISATGETPFAAYARASLGEEGAAGQPRIAIVVSGLGINLAGTLEAVEKLPDAVTLAFAPYGKSLERATAAARAEGHEILLEVPLEPFDYPENDPGPDTLLAGQAPRDNMDRLYAVMSRIGGYVGLINNMGARFTASGADFAPVMEEIGARGLGYVDDGSSNRSLAPQLAQANRVPFSRVDLTLDGNPARAPILDQLAALEDLARKNGSAIGIASALPVSVATVTEWSRSLEEKGIVLVPASSLMKP